MTAGGSVAAAARRARRRQERSGAVPPAGAAREPRAERSPDVPVESLRVRTYEIPTDAPESDGTIAWDSTTMVLVEAVAGGLKGLGWTYNHAATATLIEGKLAGVVEGRDAMAPQAAWEAMRHALRNVGTRSIPAAAMSAVDVALWDLKARLLDLPLCTLLGPLRDRVPVYGSGGFTSYGDGRLREQLAGWVAEGIGMVKMKVSRRPSEDVARVAAARDAIGDAELFVDANGALSRKEALAWAELFADHGVTWFEEPVTSDDLEGLRLLRDRAPAGMDVAAGEYGWDVHYFRRMLEAGAVDVLQADATRCGGVTGFLRAAALCEARSLPLSAHTVPALHLHVCLAAPRVVHVEWFHDHVRIERTAFDGFPALEEGAMVPDLSRPGLGLELREDDMAEYLE